MRDGGTGDWGLAAPGGARRSAGECSSVCLPARHQPAAAHYSHTCTLPQTTSHRTFPLQIRSPLRRLFWRRIEKSLLAQNGLTRATHGGSSGGAGAGVGSSDAAALLPPLPLDRDLLTGGLVHDGQWSAALASGEVTAIRGAGAKGSGKGVAARGAAASSGAVAASPGRRQVGRRGGHRDTRACEECKTRTRRRGLCRAPRHCRFGHAWN